MKEKHKINIKKKRSGKINKEYINLKLKGVIKRIKEIGRQIKKEHGKKQEKVYDREEEN